MATNSYRVVHANGTTENLGKQSSSFHQNYDVARHAAFEFALNFVVSGTLKAAIELGVFEILAKAGASASQKSLTAKEIAEQLVRPTANGTAVNSGYLQRILRLLASVNIVSESVAVVAAGEPGNFTSYNTHHQRSYALTPIGKYFVQGEDGASFAPVILMSEDWVFKKAWDHLSAAVLDDSVDPFVRAHGKSEFQLNNEDPRVNKLFNTAMSSHSRIYMEAMLEAYHGFQDVNCLVDVGGGTGTSLASITAKYPHIRGINFDLPHVVATSPAYPSTLFIPTFSI
jgi:caffeic acid 3-O-methyltransferase